MSRRTVLWIVLGVIVVHVGLFMLVGRMRALPKARYIPPPPTPNFGYRERVEEDPQTGERTIYREIQVSTKLADPRRLPARPSATPEAAPSPAAVPDALAPGSVNPGSVPE